MATFATIAQTRRNAQASAARAVPILAMPESYRPVAAFFSQLRQYLGLTHDQVAARLQTHASVIAALETGMLTDLPPWPQTRQIVWNYASMAGIDPAPALHSLELHVGSAATQPYAVATLVPDPEFEPEPEPASRTSAISKTFSSWMPRRLPFWRIVTVGCVLMVAGLFSQSSALEAAMTKLPAPLDGIVRYTKEAVLFKTSRKFEGMTWIDVENPRTRRADKLPTKRR